MANANAEVATIVPIWAGAIKYGVSKEDIEAKRAKFAALQADDRNGYEQVRLALAECRGLRVALEKRRKELKQSSLDFGRAVDKAHGDLLMLVEDLESPLQAKKDVADAEKERLKKEVADRERRELEEKVRAEREAEEAQLKAERDAAAAKLEAERAALAEAQAAFAEMQKQAEELARVERKAAEDRLAADRAQLEADRKAAMDRQREEDARAAEARAKLEADQRALDMQRAEAQRVENERLARIRAEEEAERARVEAEERARAAEEARVAEEKRRAAMQPDIQKVRATAAELRRLLPSAFPERVDSHEAIQALGKAMVTIDAVAAELAAFGAEVA